MLEYDLIQGAAAAAKYCGLKRRKIYRLVETKQLPYIRIGRCLFFRKSELNARFRSANSGQGAPN